MVRFFHSTSFMVGFFWQERRIQTLLRPRLNGMRLQVGFVQKRSKLVIAGGIHRWRSGHEKVESSLHSIRHSAERYVSCKNRDTCREVLWVQVKGLGTGARSQTAGRGQHSQKESVSGISVMTEFFFQVCES